MAKDLDAGLDKQLEIIRGIRGVRYAFYLDDEILEKVKQEEATVRSSMGGISVDNQGFLQALERDSVICLVKDPRFRPPPEPTVILEGKNGNRLGEEVFSFTMKNYQNRDDVIWMGDGFVCFLGVDAGGGETFVMPPVSFPELNESNGCKDVISCSPAPTSDRMMRLYHGLEDDSRLASVLVAFNRI